MLSVSEASKRLPNQPHGFIYVAVPPSSSLGEQFDQARG